MYGQNSGALRAELAALLRHHRIQHRLGGPIGSAPATSTEADRDEMGQLVRRYRQSILIWCRQAVTATTRDAFDGAIRVREPGIAEEFKHRLHATITASHAHLAGLDEIIEPVGNALVDTWRRAAKAATLGEHDFGNGIDYAHLSDAQCATVIGDAGGVVRALVSLDHRYRNTPGWEPLASPGRLLLAAEDCALLSVEHDPDLSVDLAGWRPPPQLVAGPLAPGFAGVIAGTHNLLIHLNQFPTIHRFRIVLESQRIVSAATATAVSGIDAGLAAAWHHRAQAFHALVARTRDVAGNLGDGRAAAQQASGLARHVRDLDPTTPTTAQSIHQLDDLFARVDGRLADLFAQGADQKLYFHRVPLPVLDGTKAGLVKRSQETFVPLTASLQRDLIAEVRQSMRQPTPPQILPPARSATTRTALGDALTNPIDPRSDAAIGF